MLAELLKRDEELRKAVERHKAVGHLAYSEGTWTPTYTGFSADPAGALCRYILVGRMCTCFVYMPNAGASNAAQFNITAPFVPPTIAGQMWWNSLAETYDNSVLQAVNGIAFVLSGDQHIYLGKAPNNYNWTAANNKRASFQITYEISGVGVGFPAGSIPAYTITNGTIDRIYDANSTTLDEIADILYALIHDLGGAP